MICRSLGGSSFHSDGPECEKERAPHEWRVRGMFRSLVDDDLSCLGGA